ncbi:MAG: hypothetical protein ACLUW6_08005 [Coriobacteriaceae bacterium]
MSVDAPASRGRSGGRHAHRRNVRSTVGTYSGVLDDLRRAFATLPDAKEQGLKAGAFSYNTGSLRCPTCDGTGQISLDVQFLPDVDIPCPDCRGSRYGREAYAIQMAIEGGVELSADAEMEREATMNLPPAEIWRRDTSMPRFRKRTHAVASRGAHANR